MWRYTSVLSVFFVVVSACFGCRPEGAESDKPVLIVFAAASIGEAIRDAADVFEREHAVRIEISSAGSGLLRRQIETGAGCDVFVSADALHMDALAAGGRLEPGTRRDIALNTLVVVTRGPSDERWAGPEPLADARVERVALGNPAYVPAGRYAKQALRRRGLWRSVEPKAVFGDNVRLVLRQMLAGGVDWAVVYQSDAAAAEACHIVYAFDAAAHTPIRYPAAMIRRVPAAAPQAELFCRFLGGAAARRVLRSHGFAVPEAGSSGDVDD
ncbi:MAG: molybdate ABC transporter substrate-binding protein [Phycisphaerae bacterium]